MPDVLLIVLIIAIVPILFSFFVEADSPTGCTIVFLLEIVLFVWFILFCMESRVINKTEFYQTAEINNRMYIYDHGMVNAENEFSRKDNVSDYVIKKIYYNKMYLGIFSTTCQPSYEKYEKEKMTEEELMSIKPIKVTDESTSL